MIIEPVAIIEKVETIVRTLFAPAPIRVHYDDLLGAKKEILAAYFRNEVAGAVVSTHGYIIRASGSYDTPENRGALSLEIAGFYEYRAGETALDWQTIIFQLRNRFEQSKALGITGVHTAGLKFSPRSIGEMDTIDESKLHFAFGQMEVFGNC